MKLLKGNPSISVPHMELDGWEVSNLWDILMALNYGGTPDLAKASSLLMRMHRELQKSESTWKPKLEIK